MKHYIKIGLKALAALMFLSAAFHLVVVFSLALIRMDLQMINPLYFFGLEKIFGTSGHTTFTVLFGWACLISAFWFCYYLVHRNKMPLAVSRQPATNKEESDSL